MAAELKVVGASSAFKKKKQVDPRRELKRVRAEAAGARNPKHKFDLWRSRKKARLLKAKTAKLTSVETVKQSPNPAEPIVEKVHDETTERQRMAELKREAQKRRLFHDVRMLRQTMKKAKQLELRKAIRKWTGERAKHEGADAAAVDKLHRQVAAIKAADLAALVSRALDKVGVRQLACETGALAASSADSTNDESTSVAPCTPAQAKEDYDAAARLLGAKCVRVLLQQLVDTHGNSKNKIPTTHTTVASNKQLHNTTAKQQPPDDEVDIETKAASARALSKLLAAKRMKTKLDQKQNVSSEDDLPLASASESDEEEGIDYPMRGSSSEEDDGEDELGPERSDEEEEQEEEEISDVTQEKGEPSQVAATVTADKNANTKGGNKAKPKPKVKKRLGQRARRRLAELQYGAAARHIQSQPSKELQAPSRTVALAAPNAMKKVTHINTNSTTHTATVPRKPQAAVSVPARSETLEGAEQLHPSWAAKRKLAEAMAAGGKGKKVKFDDGDE